MVGDQCAVGLLSKTALRAKENQEAAPMRLLPKDTGTVNTKKT